MTAQDLVIARLEAAGLTVYDSRVPHGVQARYPYALVWGYQVPKQAPVTLAGTRAAEWTIGVTVAGITPADVRTTGATVYTALQDWTPAPTDGWRFDHCRHKPGAGQAIQADGDIPPVNGAPVLFGVEFYKLTATPWED